MTTYSHITSEAKTRKAEFAVEISTTPTNEQALPGPLEENCKIN